MNPEPYIINLDGIAVACKRSRRARRVILSIKPFTGVAVAVPVGVSFKKAEEFVLTKKDWIKKHAAKMKQYEQDSGIIRDNFDDIDKAAAKETLTARLAELSEKHGFTYHKVSIRCQKTRWGSCSHTNNISLNIKLVKLPQELIDYLILHELVHTRIHNHSKKFWDELNNYVGDSRAVSRRLRAIGIAFV